MGQKLSFTNREQKLSAMKNGSPVQVSDMLGFGDNYGTLLNAFTTLRCKRAEKDANWLKTEHFGIF